MVREPWGQGDLSFHPSSGFARPAPAFHDSCRGDRASVKSALVKFDNLKSKLNDCLATNEDIWKLAMRKVLFWIGRAASCPIIENPFFS